MPEPIATKPVAPRDRPPAARTLALEIVDGPGKGKQFSDLPQRCSIGSHPSNAVVLEDPTVSRFHCDVILDGDVVRVIDRKSLNGTRIDNVDIESAIVHGNERLYLGETVMRVSLAASQAGDPAALPTRFGSLVGESAPMRELFKMLRDSAATDATILLEGETGTGKEGAAEGIHLASARADKPFVPLDCSAIPATLVESHLFGHEAGAFTGASTARQGAFEDASGGTLFLDEIGELPLDQQPKLLRALETRTIRRVGGNKQIKVDVRVIAATHRDLRAEVNHGKFRSDLFYRLAVVPIRLPPLRERIADLPILVANFLDRLNARAEARRAIADPDFMAALSRAPWPGNVRELRNHVERCIVFQEARLPAAAVAQSSGVAPYEEARRHAIEAFERTYIADLLARSNNSVAAAAKAAGIHRGYLYRLIDRYQLRE
jgi:two-component system, NtrC family, response regulator GlrR